MIMFFHFTPVGAKNGGTEVLPWSDSVRLYRRTYKQIRQEWQALHAEDDGTLGREPYRNIKCRIFADAIEREHRNKPARVEQEKPGLVAAIRNNVIHKGGFTQPGETRVVYHTHLYPSDRPTPFELYRERGTKKTAPYPEDPAEIRDQPASVFTYFAASGLSSAECQRGGPAPSRPLHSVQLRDASPPSLGRCRKEAFP
ncbi:MAG: hypothetical protein QF738_04090 [Rhodospirillales bacterium]|jgi:hypothetical protein|nr:hypothetical protein [Rhodospirillales bacterium]